MGAAQCRYAPVPPRRAAVGVGGSTAGVCEGGTTATNIFASAGHGISEAAIVTEGQLPLPFASLMREGPVTAAVRQFLDKAEVLPSRPRESRHHTGPASRPNGPLSCATGPVRPWRDPTSSGGGTEISGTEIDCDVCVKITYAMSA